MANEKIYAKGFYGKTPRVGAPTYVKGTLSIKVDDAIEFLKSNKNSTGYVNLDILTAKDEGKLSFLVNSYEPKLTQDRNDVASSPKVDDKSPESDLPF